MKIQIYIFFGTALMATILNANPIAMRKVDEGSKMEVVTLINPLHTVAAKNARVSETEKSGNVIQVHINNQEFGLTHIQTSGMCVWRLAIALPTCKKLEMLFDTLFIDSTDVLFIKDKYNNVWDTYYKHKNKPDFSSNIHSDTVILELFKATNSLSKVSISHVFPTLAYDPPKYDTVGGDCGTKLRKDPLSPCFLPANNELGNGFENQKRSVVFIYMFRIHEDKRNECYAGTGTLINNTKQDYRPLIYTVGHNLSNPITGGLGNFINHYQEYVRFYFNYDHTIDEETFFDKRENYILGTKVLLFGGCGGPWGIGCDFYNVTDQAIIEMQERPTLKMNAYYAGWTLNPTIDDTQYLTSFGHPHKHPMQVARSGFFKVSNGDFAAGSSGSAFFTNITKRIAGVFNFSLDDKNIQLGCFTQTIGSETLTRFDEYGKKPYEFQLPPTGVRPILTPGSTLIHHLDGINHCPENVKQISGSDWYSDFEGNYNTQIAGTFHVSNADLSGAKVDMQATQKITLSHGGGTLRIKPLYSTTPEGPYYYPTYFRARAIACGAYTNPTNQRVETAQGIHYKKPLIGGISPNPSSEIVSVNLLVENEYELYIYNVNGQKVYTLSSKYTHPTIDISALNSGMYQIVVYSQGQYDTQKFVVTK